MPKANLTDTDVKSNVQEDPKTGIAPKPEPTKPEPPAPKPPSDPYADAVQAHKAKIASLVAQVQVDHRALELATQAGSGVEAANLKLAQSQQALDNARLEPIAPVKSAPAPTPTPIKPGKADIDALTQARDKAQAELDEANKTTWDQDRIKAAEKALAKAQADLDAASKP